ncbi:MAG: response regulator [Oligoflexia bacterium]|nr:response regulator [Oligoflexia bacterium]
MNRKLAGRRILVVDDVDELREALAGSLQMFGADVLTASGAQEALDILESSRIDFVLSDVRMPRGDGVSLLRAMRARHSSRPPLIFMSGFADLSLQEALETGAIGLLNKPFDIKALVQVICEATSRG